MSVALELAASARRKGVSAVMVPTGQTGMMIEGWGCAVDRVISDFTNGTVEWLVEQGESRGDWVFVEGQGSIDHPAYSAVTMGLIHGATPHAMVLVHKPGLEEHDFDHLPDASFPIAELTPFIELHERIAGMVAPSKVVAMALNTSLYRTDDEARVVIDRIAAETGLPTDDPVRLAPIGSGQPFAMRSMPCRGPDGPPGGPASAARPVPIARSDHGSGTRITTVVIELRDDRFPDLVGLGEGYPGGFYGETPRRWRR